METVGRFVVALALLVLVGAIGASYLAGPFTVVRRSGVLRLVLFLARGVVRVIAGAVGLALGRAPRRVRPLPPASTLRSTRRTSRHDHFL